MKSKVFTVAASGLGYSASGVSLITEVDVTLNVTSYVYDNTEVTEDMTYYPSQIMIDNPSDKDIGFITISEDREDQIYQQHPEWFDFIPIKSKVQMNVPNAPKITKVLIKQITVGSISSGVTVVCIGYKT